MKNIVLIDANNLAMRILASSPSYDSVMKSPHQKNLIVGSFLLKLLKVINNVETKVKVNNILLIWDSIDSKRKLLYSEYKGNRYTKTNAEFEDKLNCKSLISLLKNSLKNLGKFAVIDQIGYEADDLIAYIVKNGEYDNNYVIVSNDSDFYQLLGKRVMIMKHDKSFYTSIDFIKEFDTIPDKYVYIKALAGDSSDNIKGVKGIGIKKAIKLIKENRCWIYWVDKYKDYDLDTNHELIKLPFDEKNINIDIPQSNFNFSAFSDLFQEFSLSQLKISDFKNILSN